MGVRAVKIAAIGAFSAGLFLWGFFANLRRVFPYSLMRSTYDAAFVDTSKNRIEVRSPSAPPDLLSSLPYLSSAPDPHGSDSGILLYDKDRAFDGYTLYGPRTEAKALLIRMDGDVVAEWSEPHQPLGWQHIELLPGGGLLATVKDFYALRLDAESHVIWRYEGRPHHDLSVLGNEVWMLTRESRVVPSVNPITPTVVDKITVLNLETGAVIREINLLDLIQSSPYSFLLAEVGRQRFGTDTSLDILHANHVEVFDGSQSAQSPLFRRGNVMVSMKCLSAVMIFNPETLSIEWIWGPSNLIWQHDPTLTPQGTLLLFDNRWHQSRVLEIDPKSYDIVWEYTEKGFFSALRGGVQRLGNGNTLITESDTGHVFEVTPGRERVWEFATPYFSRDGNRAAIWRATRFTRDELPFLH